MEPFVSSALLLAVVIGLTEVVKRLGLNDKYAPVFAIVLGVILSFGVERSITFDATLEGIVLGLTSVGLYSSAKNIGQGISGSIG